MSSNCKASVAIGCLLCCHGCNVNKLVNAFTFLPPQSSYTIEEAPSAEDGDDELADGAGHLVYLIEGVKTFGEYQEAADLASVRFVRTSKGHRIPLIWIKSSDVASKYQDPNARYAPATINNKPIVLLHCHGNATDIGMMMGPYLEFAKRLGVDVVGFEYTGYGDSTGPTSSNNILGDIEAAFNYILSKGIPSQNIIAYGQSVGSGPAMKLASKESIGGVILHSPLMSGIKVIDPEPSGCCRPSNVYHFCDFYPNDKWIRKVGCPTFVIHGQLDDIIPFHHGYRLAESTPKEHRWPGYFPRDAGHNDIIETGAISYFRELAAFVSRVAEGRGGFLIKPEQENMAIGRVLASQTSRSSRNQFDPVAVPPTSFPEPAVGPDDGRYKQMRRVDSPSRKGAREVEVTQIGDSLKE